MKSSEKRPHRKSIQVTERSVFLITFAILTHLFFIVKQNTPNYYILYVKFFSNTICCVYCFAYTNNYSLKQTQFSERKAAIKKPFSGGIAHTDRRALKIFILTPKSHAFLRLRLCILCIIIFDNTERPRHSVTFFTAFTF